MNFKCKPLYLKFPIFQTVFIIFWVLIGHIISGILSGIVILTVYKILSAILNVIYYFAFQMYVLSGRAELLVEFYYKVITVAFYFILLIVGLELISHFLNKKKKNGGFDEHSSNEQD